MFPSCSFFFRTAVLACYFFPSVCIVLFVHFDVASFISSFFVRDLFCIRIVPFYIPLLFFPTNLLCFLCIWTRISRPTPPPQFRHSPLRGLFCSCVNDVEIVPLLLGYLVLWVVILTGLHQSPIAIFTPSYGYPTPSTLTRHRR